MRKLQLQPPTGRELKRGPVGGRRRGTRQPSLGFDVVFDSFYSGYVRPPTRGFGWHPAKLTCGKESIISADPNRLLA